MDAEKRDKTSGAAECMYAAWTGETERLVGWFLWLTRVCYHKRHRIGDLGISSLSLETLGDVIEAPEGVRTMAAECGLQR